MPLEGDFKQQAETARAELVELVADVDEQLAESFLQELPISAEELAAAVRRATLALKFVPIFMGRYAVLVAPRQLTACDNAGTSECLPLCSPWLCTEYAAPEY